MTDQEQGPQNEIDYRRVTILILAGLIIVAFVVFVAQNGEDVRIDFLSFQLSTPLWLLVLVSMAAGAVLWGALSWVRRRRRRKARREAT